MSNQIVCGPNWFFSVSETVNETLTGEQKNKFLVDNNAIEFVSTKLENLVPLNPPPKVPCVDQECLMHLFHQSDTVRLPLDEKKHYDYKMK